MLCSSAERSATNPRPLMPRGGCLTFVCETTRGTGAGLVTTHNVDARCCPLESVSTVTRSATGAKLTHPSGMYGAKGDAQLVNAEI